MMYYIYEIKNNINNKTYIGQHKTNDLNDDYMGSGIILHQAYQKYGKKNFTKTILAIAGIKENQQECIGGIMELKKFIQRNALTDLFMVD